VHPRHPHAAEPDARDFGAGLSELGHDSPPCAGTMRLPVDEVTRIGCMPSINEVNVYARDLDLNLLRVFVVVALQGSVTSAAKKLYLTQPAVSAALKRLSLAVGAPLFARRGRGLALTTRGERLLQTARPHLEALVGATLSSEAFDPKKSD